ncbi:hypothetical protein HHI36_019830 [Cryptolaemus montrouzieri]|uniref:Uncharacterized protein n=1 Tax=Cryptolaemus montrouzieri TaxID=559131 RepID=A0ABD2N8R7_9CUCU
MKLLLSVVLIFVAVSLHDGETAEVGLLNSIPHDYFECEEARATYRVYDRLIQKSGKPNTKVDVTIKLPKIGLLSRPITCISIEDLDGNGVGGFPEVISGGLNYRFVTISLESQVGKGLSFAVKIYTDQYVPQSPVVYRAEQNVTAVDVK